MSGIKLLTKCDECIHGKVCSRRCEPNYYLNKISKTMYGDGPNDDYALKDMVKSHRININISCEDFEKQQAKPRIRTADFE